MKAVILVAGVSRRLYPLTEHRPKCLMEVGGRTILDHQLAALKAVGVREVCLVLGYRREQIMAHVQQHYPELSFEFRVNHHFFETNTALSLLAAADTFLDRDFIYLNGDVLFEPALLARVVASPHRAALAVEAKPCGDEEVKAVVDGSGRISALAKTLDPATALGEFIGVARFNAPFTAWFYKALEAIKHEGLRNAYFEAALDRMAPDHAMHAVDVTDLPCIEIDFPEDYEAACAQVVTRFQRA
ncbi:MAG: phosphocholine cytidylyltransferase family protein [Myxococcales bacterium]|nr:phosphocholine cytidylyltransferase family protein [Myxococcales bacterium]MCB9526676.1 phosphocholine cytidylyltransferase family protein [Myxococcales bacterium]